MKIVQVFVRLKPGVLDPQGATVAHSLHALGFGEVGDVRVGKLIELRLEDGGDEAQTQTRVRAMCEKLLANTVIEDYEIVGG